MYADSLIQGLRKIELHGLHLVHDRITGQVAGEAKPEHGDGSLILDGKEYAGGATGITGRKIGFRPAVPRASSDLPEPIRALDPEPQPGGDLPEPDEPLT